MDYEVIIIGAGFSGLCLAHKLVEQGITNFTVLEKAEDVGGTWRDNTYPGCACDVQSHLYSYSFEGNAEWSESYAGWKEIQQYIQGFVRKHQLRRFVTFKQEMAAATFDERTGTWRVETRSGDLFRARFLIMGTGPLHVPAIPSFPGRETFKGAVFHSARWDHKVSLSGKRVISIGTGGSAIQYIPEVAKLAQKLTVMQRTPAWVLPRKERAYTPMEKALFRKSPALRTLHRLGIYLKNEARLLAVWNPSIANLYSNVAVSHIKKSIKDPAMVARLTPDYTIGCKRILLSNTYYPTFNRKNVSLVTDGIDRLVPEGVVTKDGALHEADVIVLGTGFVVDPRDYLQQVPIRGRGGVQLLDVWQDGPEAYLGMTVSGFPNLFQMTGPNTALGHNSIIFMIESMVAYILDAIHTTKRRNCLSLEVQSTVQQAYNRSLQTRLKGTVWTTGCTSWYQQKEGKNIAIWPGSTLEYRWRTRRIRASDFSWVAEPQASNVVTPAGAMKVDV